MYCPKFFMRFSLFTPFDYHFKGIPPDVHILSNNLHLVLFYHMLLILSYITVV